MLSEKTKQHFQGKVIWVTGASSGIGRALVIALSECDCKIFISSRSKENLALSIEKSPQNNIIALEGDLTSKEVNQQIVKKIKDNSSGLDIAILNAGSCEYVSIENFDSGLFKRQMDTNFMSMVYGIEAVLPLLKISNDAQLIGMSSTAAYLGLPRSEAYGATKAAIRNLFAALHVSLRPYDISASVICPGFVETELTAKNDFNMPALISAEQAARYTLDGIAAYKQEIHYPKRFSFSLKLISSLPNPLLSWLLAKAVIRK